MLSSFIPETDAQKLVRGFPAVFTQAVTDLAKYKAAKERGLVPFEKQQVIEDWFYHFPQLWATIQPNWQWGQDGKPASADKLTFAENVNRFVIRLRGEPYKPAGQLGIAPLLIAGILIAAAFGAAGLTWALGYVLEQKNISSMVAAVADGRMPPDVLKEKIKQEHSSVFGIGDTLKSVGTILIFGSLFFLLPKFFPSPGSKRG